MPTNRGGIPFRYGSQQCPDDRTPTPRDRTLRRRAGRSAALGWHRLNPAPTDGRALQSDSSPPDRSDWPPPVPPPRHRVRFGTRRPGPVTTKSSVVYAIAQLHRELHSAVRQLFLSKAMRVPHVGTHNRELRLKSFRQYVMDLEPPKGRARRTLTSLTTRAVKTPCAKLRITSRRDRGTRRACARVGLR